MKNSKLFTLLMLIFSGCVTNVSFQVQRAPQMDTAGIKRVAIMPFETSNNTSLQREMAQLLTSKTISNIRAANYFTLVDHSEIERLQKRGERIENHVDALFAGQIVSLRTSDSNRTEERKNNKTGEIYEVTVYERAAELVFSYRLIRARDGSIIDMVSREGKNEDYNEKRQDLKSNSLLLEELVTKQLAGLAKEVAPYTAVVSRSLMDEKTKDKELKNSMKEAAGIVKEGNYRIAYNRYLEIYGQYGNVAAGYNAAIMLEALGEINSAITMIENVYGETGNSQARGYLNRLNESLRERERYIAGYTEAGNQVNRITAFAVDEIYGVLPRNAKLWVFNSSKEETTLAGNIADGITAAFLRRGVIVVDRENSRLVEAEHNLQMSGYTSDNDFVSIGNAAGANTLVIIAISGVSNLRRLQLRVLDIETRTSLYQSDAGDKWKL